MLKIWCCSNLSHLIKKAPGRLWSKYLENQIQTEWVNCPYTHSSVILLFRFITFILFPNHITMVTVTSTASTHPYIHNLSGHGTFYPCHLYFGIQLRARGEIQTFYTAAIPRFSILHLILIDWMTHYNIKTSGSICSFTSTSDINSSPPSVACLRQWIGSA